MSAKYRELNLQATALTMVSNGSPVWWGEGGTTEEPCPGRSPQPTQAPVIEITDPEDFIIERRRPSSSSIEFPQLHDNPPPYESVARSHEQRARVGPRAEVNLRSHPQPRKRAVSTASATTPLSASGSRSRSTSAPSSPQSSSPVRDDPRPDNHSVAIGMGIGTVTAMAVGIGYVK